MVSLHYDRSDDNSRNSSSQILSDLYPIALYQLHLLYVNRFHLLHYQNLNQGSIYRRQHELHTSGQSNRHDALGEKVVFTGVLEDSKSKVSFVSHKIAVPLIRDSVYYINSAYVHEFPDRLLLLVITEFTKLESKNVEDIREYTWVPKISDINRPIRYIFLNGTVSIIHNTSGLIKRCSADC